MIIRRITWYTDDEVEYFGWLEGSPRTDLPEFVVKPVDNVWAGWTIDEFERRTCATHDHETRHDAMAELEAHVHCARF